MAKSRNWQKYQVRDSRKIVHGGITSRSLEERLAEHQQTWPGATISKVGRATTKEGAQQWEKDKGYS